MSKKILAKLRAESGCHVVVLARDEEGKQVWDESTGQKLSVVRAIPLGFLGFVPADGSGAFAAMLGLGSPPPWIPLDPDGAEIEGPVAYLMPGETLQEWAAKGLAEEAARKEALAEERAQKAKKG